MGQGRPRLRLVAAFALALTLVLGVGAGVAEAKKKKGGGFVDITRLANLPIPDRPTGAASQVGVTRSTIDIGTQFKGKRIRDVNATIQLTGSEGDATGDITAVLSAPNGGSVTLVDGQPGSTQLGPLTLDDESSNRLGFGPPPTQSVPGTLFAPYQGSAMPVPLPLTLMDNGPVRGTWNLTLVDSVTGATSVLNFWRLQVTAGMPFRTK